MADLPLGVGSLSHLNFVAAGILGFMAVSLALRISRSAVARLPGPAVEASATT